MKLDSFSQANALTAKIPTARTPGSKGEQSAFLDRDFINSLGDLISGTKPSKKKMPDAPDFGFAKLISDLPNPYPGRNSQIDLLEPEMATVGQPEPLDLERGNVPKINFSGEELSNDEQIDLPKLELANAGQSEILDLEPANAAKFNVSGEELSNVGQIDRHGPELVTGGQPELLDLEPANVAKINVSDSELPNVGQNDQHGPELVTGGQPELLDLEPANVAKINVSDSELPKVGQIDSFETELVTGGQRELLDLEPANVAKIGVSDSELQNVGQFDSFEPEIATVGQPELLDLETVNVAKISVLAEELANVGQEKNIDTASADQTLIAAPVLQQALQNVAAVKNEPVGLIKAIGDTVTASSNGSDVQMALSLLDKFAGKNEIKQGNGPVIPFQKRDVSVNSPALTQVGISENSHSEISAKFPKTSALLDTLHANEKNADPVVGRPRGAENSNRATSLSNFQTNPTAKHAKTRAMENINSITTGNGVKIGSVKLEGIAPANFGQLIIDTISSQAKPESVLAKAFSIETLSTQLPKTLTVQLFPRSLGVVEVKISSVNGRLNIAIETNTAAAEKVLKTEMSAVVDKLLLNGLSHDEITVRNNPNLEYLRDENAQSRSGNWKFEQSNPENGGHRAGLESQMSSEVNKETEYSDESSTQTSVMNRGDSSRRGIYL